MTRIELMTTRLSGVCSTTELHALLIIRFYSFHFSIKESKTNKMISFYLYINQKLMKKVGMAGVEPTHIRIKNKCLTTWLHSIISFYSFYFSIKESKTNK